jgi:hypothetical protein
MYIGHTYEAVVSSQRRATGRLTRDPIIFTCRDCVHDKLPLDAHVSFLKLMSDSA